MFVFKLTISYTLVGVTIDGNSTDNSILFEIWLTRQMRKVGEGLDCKRIFAKH